MARVEELEMNCLNIKIFVMKSNQSLQKQDEKLQNVLYNDACVIIEQAKIVAYKSVDEILIKRNWLLGMRIQHEVLKD